VTTVNTLATPTGRPPATPAPIPLGDTLCGYRTVVSVSSALCAVVATITKRRQPHQTDATGHNRAKRDRGL